jgi:hypothetical protein
MSPEFVRASIAALARRTGILHPDRAEWMVPLIIEADQSGLPLDRAILKDARLPETLTETGMTNPGEAVAAIIRCAPFARNHARDRETGAKTGNPQRFTPVKDKRTCQAAIARHGQVFPQGSEPMLPLPECDAWNCRCTFIGWPASMARRGL